MIHYLVFQNADEPAPFRRSAAEFFVTAHSGEKCFLHQVFGHFRFVGTTGLKRIDKDNRHGRPPSAILPLNVIHNVRLQILSSASGMPIVIHLVTSLTEAGVTAPGYNGGISFREERDK